MMAGIVHLQALSRIDDLAPLRAAVMEFLAPLALPQRVLYDVDIVLEELFMNIVLHAHEDGRAHAVDLRVELKPGSIRLRLDDRGRPFDPTNRPEPEHPRSIAEARPGGLGLGLVRQHSTSMFYARREGCNSLTVTIGRR
jgi:anti-sigma regulatory factor (Ser/Thr protein kinase)